MSNRRRSNRIGGTQSSDKDETTDVGSNQHEVSVLTAEEGPPALPTNEDDPPIDDNSDELGEDDGSSVVDSAVGGDKSDQSRSDGVPRHVNLGGVARAGSSTSSDDISAFSSVNTKDFHLRYDFPALRAKLATVDQAVARCVEEGLNGLVGEIRDLKKKETSLKERLVILTRGYQEKCGKGKRKFAKEVRGLDLVNLGKVRNCLNSVVPDMILRDGWAVYSTRETSFCQKFIKYSDVSVPNEFSGWKDYWNSFLAPTINYQISNKRNNLVQKIRMQWTSELTCAFKCF